LQQGYETLRQTVLSLAGWDLDCYRSQQLERRLRTLLARTRTADLREYADLLRSEPQRLLELSDLLTVNVSEFFRNPERFTYCLDIIRQHRASTFSLWSAGCANGAEPYSLAMLCEEAGVRSYTVLATDVDPCSLERAANAAYKQQDLVGVSEERKHKFFKRRGDEFCVAEHIRKRVRFVRHNLLSDPYPAQFDLIACRNVLIYFTESAKESVIRLLSNSLRPGGHLFIGSTETIWNAADAHLVQIAPFFYRRKT